MCSVLIVGPSYPPHPDPALQWQRLQPGDVVDIKDDDDFHWGSHIHCDPNDGTYDWWIVVSVPGTTAADANGLIWSDPEPFPLTPYRLRTSYIDLASFLEAHPIVIGPQEEPDIIVDFASLISFRKQRPALDNDNVIGDPNSVIG